MWLTYDGRACHWFPFLTARTDRHRLDRPHGVPGIVFKRGERFPLVVASCASSLEPLGLSQRTKPDTEYNVYADSALHQGDSEDEDKMLFRTMSGTSDLGEHTELYRAISGASSPGRAVP